MVPSKARSSPSANSIAWSLDSTRIFYAAGPVSVVDLTTGAITALTAPSGFGSDFSVSHDPVAEKIAYLRVKQDVQTARQGGSLIVIDTSTLTPQIDNAPQGVELYATSAHFGPDSAVVISTSDSIYLFDTDYGSSVQVLNGLAFAPVTAFNPPGDMIAYTGAGTVDPAVTQIFTVPRAGGETKQLTNHTDGTIADLVWLPG